MVGCSSRGALGQNVAVVQELPELVANDPTFKQLDASNASIFGHSMGGNGQLTLPAADHWKCVPACAIVVFPHKAGVVSIGALMIALKNPDAYKSASAFAPIANPVTSSLAQKGRQVHSQKLACLVIYTRTDRHAEVIHRKYPEHVAFAAFKEYLGNDFERWRQYDATECAAQYAGPKKHILIDQGKRQDCSRSMV
jgi:S-formylglutathione hydrolase